MDPNELLLRDKKQLILLILDPSLVGFSLLVLHISFVSDGLQPSLQAGHLREVVRGSNPDRDLRRM